MQNPWEEILLSDYENHMSLESVMQLQGMNSIMAEQFSDYPVRTAMVLGVAGGNGLEHIDPRKYCVVYGIDINHQYLEQTEKRFPSLSGILDLRRIDLMMEFDQLPQAELVIANLFIEYIGYHNFRKAIQQIQPQYVTCVIQLNEEGPTWVSNSPYLHVFDKLDTIHCQMNEPELTNEMNSISFLLEKREERPLPNGKKLLRLDYHYSHGEKNV